MPASCNAPESDYSGAEWHEWFGHPGAYYMHDSRIVHVQPGDLILVTETEEGGLILWDHRPRGRLH